MSFIVGDAKYINGVPIETGTPTDVDVLMYDAASGTWKHNALTSSAIIEVAQDAAYSMFNAGSHTGITFTYSDIGNSMAGAVLYGTTVATACIGNDSRLTDARAPLSHSYTLISDWTEAVQDTVGAFLSGGDCITATYDDAGNVESIGVTDNSLTLAKLQHGGSNEVIMYDKDGIPSALSIGQTGLDIIEGKENTKINARVKRVERIIEDYEGGFDRAFLELDVLGSVLPTYAYAVVTNFGTFGVPVTTTVDLGTFAAATKRVMPTYYVSVILYVDCGKFV